VSDIAWALPASIVLLAALVIAGVVTLVVRARRRSPRAVAAASEARAAAEAALQRLDDAATALDVAFEAADADDAPMELRRARAAALRGRDRGFAEVAALTTSSRLPAQRRADAVRLRDDIERRIASVEETRSDLDAWTRTHGSVAGRIAAARARREEIARTAGDPARLVGESRARFDDTEWTDADRAEREARAALTRADAALAAAADTPEVADERVTEAHLSLRRAARLFRAVEDAHRFVLQAAENADAEVSAADVEIAAALELVTSRHGEVAPDAAQRLRAATADLRAASGDLPYRPRAAIEVVARAREIRDEVLGDIPSSRRRLEAARAALPGTLACARAAVASAEAFTDGSSIAERLRLDAARRELAAARSARDAFQALASARAAWHAVTDA
jgi:hypothetical protein